MAPSADQYEAVVAMAGDEMGGERLVVGGIKITVTRKIFFLWRATDDWCRDFNFQNSYGAGMKLR